MANISIQYPSARHIDALNMTDAELVAAVEQGPVGQDRGHIGARGHAMRDKAKNLGGWDDEPAHR